MFLGIRGRISKKSPIRIGTAFFCENAFLNQLGLNPVFTFIRSYLDSQSSDNTSINLIAKEKAYDNIKQYLKIDDLKYKSPIARDIQGVDSFKIKPNIVFIIMESMSAAKMTRHGNPNNLTPFLDSLSYESLYFDQIYTAGKHTFNGIFSTLFSFPAIYSQHPMKDSDMAKYNGISQVLQENGYSTTYFTTHDGQFDNVEGFLRHNNFEQIISEKDYPSEEIKSTLGVPDDYMFRFAIPKLDELALKNKPFFTTFMTTSDHGPYYVPPYFKPNSKNIKQQIVEYADWSLRQFIEDAREKPWFDNTIFMFVADHGAPMNFIYDISLAYHHSPLIFYAPSLIEPELISKIGGQIDVFPTTMGLLQMDYINNTLGIDLKKESRPFIIINEDDKFGVLDTTYFLIVKKDAQRGLYHYKDGNKTNLKGKYPDKAKAMEEYGNTQLQIFQEMEKEKLLYFQANINKN